MKPKLPGFRFEYRFPQAPDLTFQVLNTPRYFLGQPTLAPQDVLVSNALGVYLIRVWRF